MTSSRLLCAAVAAALSWVALIAAPAFADPLLPRESADVGAPDSGSIGVFNPLRIGLRRAELELHPLTALVVPHADLRLPLLRAQVPGGWRVTGIVGLALPTPAWRLDKPFGLSGDLVPSCKVANYDANLAQWCDKPGWLLAPKLGVQVSKGLAVDGTIERAVATLSADVADGWAMTGTAARPLDAWAPVAVQFAPYVGRFRAQVKLAYDHAVLDSLRLRAELAGRFVARPADDTLSPWFWSGHLGVDIRTTSHTRLALGAMYWNYDKHERKVGTNADGFASVSYVRSHEVWPAVDFLWSWGETATPLPCDCPAGADGSGTPAPCEHK